MSDSRAIADPEHSACCARSRSMPTSMYMPQTRTNDVARTHAARAPLKSGHITPHVLSHSLLGASCFTVCSFLSSFLPPVSIFSRGDSRRATIPVCVHWLQLIRSVKHCNSTSWLQGITRWRTTTVDNLNSTLEARATSPPATAAAKAEAVDLHRHNARLHGVPIGMISRNATTT